MISFCCGIKVPSVFIILFLRLITANVLFKCVDFESDNDFLTTSPGSGFKTVIIPGAFMANFESATFRLESTSSSFCPMNYEIIKINLIGSDTININPIQDDLYSYTEPPQQVESHFNTTPPIPRKLYGSFGKSRNGSYSEAFMYSVENISAILNTSGTTSVKEEEENLCEEEKRLSRSHVHFTPSGVLVYSGEYYRSNEYCVQSVNEIEQSISIRKCKVDCSNWKTPCIPLCCHLHEHVDLSVSCCQATLGSKPMFQPVIYDDINRRLSLEETITEPSGISVTTASAAIANRNGKAVNDDAVLKPHYVSFKYHNACPDGLEPLYVLFNENGESELNTRIHIKSNGKAAYIGDDRKWNFLHNYCVAGILSNSTAEDGSMTIVMQYCLDEEVRGVLWPSYLLIGVFAFSSVFLLFTVIVYVLLWEKQNIHGWTIISFVTSEFFLFTFLSVSYALSLFISADDASRTSYCTGSGILAHFFFLSTFSWLTVINLDLWWTFKSLTPLSERSKGRKRFCLYMAFAWGLSITVVSVGLTLQSIYKENSSNVVVPDYGNRQCFLATTAKGVYLYYIIGVLLLANCILISLTFLTIYKFKKSTRVASSSSSNKNKERSFKLFLKLVVVMGVTWIFEFIMWLDNDEDGKEFSWMFLVVDLLNVLQAVATFIIFVCKRKIMNQLEQKHPSLRVITRPLLKLMSGHSNNLMTSSSSKQTRSTAAGSSILQRSSRNKSQKQKPGNPTADSKV